MTELNLTALQKPYKILLVGDICYDVYHYGTVDRLSPEAPVPVFNPNRTETKLGMAYNVADNLRSFNCVVDLYNHNTKLGHKNRYIDERSKQHLIRIDEDVDVEPIDISKVDWEYYDAVVVSDYNKGAIDYNTLSTINESFNGPILVDTKKTDLTGLGKCIFKINALEYSRLLDHSGELIVTRGSEGTLYKCVNYPVDKVEVVDVCGAGDTFLAALTWAYLVTKSIPESIVFANKCASISVQHSGVYALKKEDLNSVLS